MFCAEGSNAGAGPGSGAGNDDGCAGTAADAAAAAASAAAAAAAGLRLCLLGLEASSNAVPVAALATWAHIFTYSKAAEARFCVLRCTDKDIRGNRVEEPCEPKDLGHNSRALAGLLGASELGLRPVSWLSCRL